MFFRFDEITNKPVFDEEAYQASVSRRRKKRLQYRQMLLAPDTEIDFEEVTGLVTNIDAISFPTGITALSGPVSGQVLQQPGAIKLKESTEKTKLGFWSSLPGEIWWANPVNLKSINLISGNFDNYKMDMECRDASGNSLGHTLFSSSTDMFMSVDINTANVSRLIITRNPTSMETRSPNAVGTILVIGGRPRPPIYTKSIFIASITFRS